MREGSAARHIAIARYFAYATILLFFAAAAAFVFASAIDAAIRHRYIAATPYFEISRQMLRYAVIDAITP